MLQLTYISTATPGTTPAMVGEILSASRRNNAAANVTGLLLYDGHRFLQALEGPEAAVQTTFDRIHKDPRHFALVQLARESITERSFPNWAMGAQAGMTPHGAATIDEAVSALIAPIKDASLKGYFSGFAERQAAA